MPVNIQLPADEVHVWLLRADRITDPAVLRRLERLMNAQEPPTSVVTTVVKVIASSAGLRNVSILRRL